MLYNNGVVVKSTGSWYTVQYDGKYYECRIRGKFRLQGIRSTNPVAVGDFVDFEFEHGDDRGQITAIADRKNYIVRKSTNLSHQVQVLAANIDMAFLVITLADPRTELRFIDRFLVSAEAYKVPVSLVLNKADLYSEDDLLEAEALMGIYSNIGYRCYVVSATTGEGVSDLRTIMRGKTCMVSGNSGVGKSTLINAIDPELSLKIGAISAAHQKGKHTTTFAEMFDIETGGKIIDTPGVKSFGMVNTKPEELAHYFPEMFALLDDCKFYNCTHTHEPGCAVKQAVDEMRISPTRYDSYLHLLEAEDTKYRGAGY